MAATQGRELAPSPQNSFQTKELPRAAAVGPPGYPDKGKEPSILVLIFPECAGKATSFMHLTDPCLELSPSPAESVRAEQEVKRIRGRLLMKTKGTAKPQVPQTPNKTFSSVVSSYRVQHK